MSPLNPRYAPGMSPPNAPRANIMSPLNPRGNYAPGMSPPNAGRAPNARANLVSPPNPRGNFAPGMALQAPNFRNYMPHRPVATVLFYMSVLAFLAGIALGAYFGVFKTAKTDEERKKNGTIALVSLASGLVIFVLALVVRVMGRRRM